MDSLNLRIFFELNSKGLYQSSGKEIGSCCMVFRIPDSTSKNLADSGIPIPLFQAIPTVLLSDSFKMIMFFFISFVICDYFTFSPYSLFSFRLNVRSKLLGFSIRSQESYKGNIWLLSSPGEGTHGMFGQRCAPGAIKKVTVFKTKIVHYATLFKAIDLALLFWFVSLKFLCFDHFSLRRNKKETAVINVSKYKRVSGKKKRLTWRFVCSNIDNFQCRISNYLRNSKMTYGRAEFAFKGNSIQSVQNK